VSNLAIAPQGHLDLFTMRGPLWKTTTARFNLEMLNARTQNGIRKVTKNFFRLRNTGFNQAVISLVESIPGPQEIELQLSMDLNHNGEHGGSAVAKLFIFVSQYEY
jgi:fibulin 1/2